MRIRLAIAIVCFVFSAAVFSQSPSLKKQPITIADKAHPQQLQGSAQTAQQKMDKALQFSKEGKYVASIELYQDLLKNHVAELKKDIALQALVYLELSFSHSSLGNQKEEIDYVEKAIEIMESHFTQIKETDYVTAYNNLHYYYGEYDDSKGLQQTHQKFAAYFKARFKTKEVSPVYYYARRVLRKMEVIAAGLEDDPKKAVAIIQGFRDEIKQSPAEEKNADWSYLLASYSSLCDYYNYSSTDHAAGIQAGNAFLQTAIALKDSFNIMLSHSKLANQYRELGNYKKALYHVEASLQSFQFPPTSISRFSLETMKAMNLASLQDYVPALAMVEKNILSLLQTHIGPNQQILSFNPQLIKQLNNSRYVNIFASSALIFIEAYRQQKKPLYIEKAEKLVSTASLLFGEYYKKGSYNGTLNNLHKKIVEGYLFVAIEKYPNAYLPKKRILEQIEKNTSFHLAKSFELQLLKQNTPIAKLMHELQWQQQQKEFWSQEQIEKGKTVDYSKKIQEQVVAIKKLEKEIAEKQKAFTNFTLANYSVDACMQLLQPQQAILKYYVATNHAFRVLITHDDIDIQQLGTVKELAKKVNAYNTLIKKPNSNWKPLSAALYEQLVKGVQPQQITIIPDNFLNYLSFESLYNAASKQFLVSNFPVTYNYSLSLWYLHQKNRNTPETTKLSAFAPDYTATVFKQASLAKLPFAKAEAEQVARIYQGEAFTGSAASKENFYDQSNKASMLHCATHAVLYDNNFNESCLLFNQAKPLYLKELYTTAMPLEMVVLSACNTGAGKLVEGEGLMSLSRAFTYAGVKSTVVSLWQVPDKETAAIMVLFYQNLHKGLNKAAALSKAKQDFVGQYPLYAHPYFWSGFILTGNDAPLSAQSGPWFWVVLIGAVLLLATGVYYFIRLRKKA